MKEFKNSVSRSIWEMEAKGIFYVPCSRSLSFQTEIKTTSISFMQPCFQCFSVRCSSSFPGTLLISPIFPLPLSQTAAQTRFQLWHLKDAWFQPGLAVMLWTIHTQGKSTHSFSTEATAECMYAMDGAPVISGSLFKGSLGVSYSFFSAK